MAKPLQDMTRAELRAYIARCDRAYSKACDALIAAGRGHERVADCYGKADPLSRAMVNASESGRFAEAERRRRVEWHGSEHRIVREVA